MPKSNQDRRQQTLDNLIALREEASREPKVTYTKDGTRYEWTEWMKMLTEQIDKLQDEIDNTSGDGIVEEHTTAWL